MTAEEKRARSNRILGYLKLELQDRRCVVGWEDPDGRLQVSRMFQAQQRTTL
jgi:hypothetical protein